MVAIGRGCYDGDGFILTSPTEASYTTERPRETLCKVQSITVTNTSPLDFDVTLDRITAMLTIQSTDGRPAGISKIRTTYSKGGKSFNPTTGLATSNTGFWQTNSPSAAVGTTIKVNSCPLLASADDEEERIDITIEVLDNEEKTTSYELHTDAEYLKGAMDELAAKDSTFKVEGSDGEYGFFIEAVNGITADFETDKAYWAIYVNDEYGQYGADQQPVNDGDVFRLAYEISTY